MIGAIAPKKVDEEQPWARVMMLLINAIPDGPPSAYMRRRVPEMVAVGEPMQVAIPQAMAEYVKAHPVNPGRAKYSPCPLCGRPARVYAGGHGWPDMAHCERCDRTHIVRPDEPAAVAEPAQAEEVQTGDEWWND